MERWYRLIFMGLSIFFVASQAWANQPTAVLPVNSVVAIVNNSVVTQNELNQATTEAISQGKAQGMTLPNRIVIEREVLQSLIMQKIALQLAELNNITVSSDQVNQTIAGIAAQHGLSVSALYTKLAASGVDQASYRDTIRTQLIVQALEQEAVAGSIVITLDQVNTYLANQVRLAHTHTQYDVAHILIAFPDHVTPSDDARLKQKALDVVAKIKAGLSFESAVKTYSDSGDASSGGNLGFKTLNDLPPAFVEPVTTLHVGEVSSPIRTDSGYNIIKLVAKKGDNTVGSPHYITEYHVRAILIKASPVMDDAKVKAQLERLQVALQNGASFASLALANSQDYFNSKNGGDMGWINPSQLDTTLAAHIRNTPVNTVSAPFKAADGWYLIEVLGTRQTNDSQSYDTEQAEQALFMRKANEALLAWQAQIKGASYIKILDPQLDTTDASSSS